MTDQQSTPDLTTIARTDQRMSEITDTAGRVAMYYRLLTGNGISESAAAEMTSEYNSLVIARHFQDVHQAINHSTIYINGEDD